MTFTTPKHRSRERVVQALYQYIVSGGEVLKIEQQFLNQKSGKISKAFFSNLFINILKNRTELDALIAPTISREANELGTVEQAVLYLGAYELQNSIEVPYKVVINEALEVAKLYGAEGAFKLVNASLDKLAQSLRKIEIEASK
ncbi:Transcription termination protein NusB [Bathymodiolus thermophilus thioautotrophic gill symbiont]|uniref:Transcription antitermination protein NusB n=1 Tax=Bathymodiolus thermophilus thioautotrophic gill symbiont TaxID=2360 RepID=A0A1J5UDM4_9GAMM|nr:transcription antitermination factor NusB [Bathymodiolus thermophilus thioautotrophic gill symbiont]AYQ56858.1 N utilization substance protein B [Bathymodiolus thermophilus thioautotrophic gill symbiont]AYQ56866.1 N utilization substance protein B [Bathymodiolus thermophilus thioautotrophic gill symbiont]OIR24029.1 transcription antitermination factor NusB [Bathymodiolus thermophilus thioautotrophic gill symbiont]CAB5495875.1 Transcription termination protein NusB [Bathymodiolus thermophilus